jgi:hypothetical protein
VLDIFLVRTFFAMIMFLQALTFWTGQEIEQFPNFVQ